MEHSSKYKTSPKSPVKWHAHAMGGLPETHYARDGDLYLAYQVVGESGPDLLYVPIAIWPIDLVWDDPTWPVTFAGWHRSAD